MLKWRKTVPYTVHRHTETKWHFHGPRHTITVYDCNNQVYLRTTDITQPGKHELTSPQLWIDAGFSQEEYLDVLQWLFANICPEDTLVNSDEQEYDGEVA